MFTCDLCPNPAKVSDCSPDGKKLCWTCYWKRQGKIIEPEEIPIDELVEGNPNEEYQNSGVSTTFNSKTS